jgi:hypothetical protein
MIHHAVSVAFITGRKESERASTAANLKEAGYGGLCESPDMHTMSFERSEVKDIAEELRWPQHRPMLPCYVALHLREQNDTRCLQLQLVPHANDFRAVQIWTLSISQCWHYVVHAVGACALYMLCFLVLEGEHCSERRVCS